MLDDPQAPHNTGTLERALVSPVDGRRIVVRYERLARPSPSEDITMGALHSVFFVMTFGGALVAASLFTRPLVRSLSHHWSPFNLVIVCLTLVPLLMAFSWRDGIPMLRRGRRNSRGAHSMAGTVVSRARREFYMTSDDGPDRIETVHYLAVDDGTQDVILAWPVRAQMYHDVALGDRMRVRTSADHSHPYAMQVIP